MSIHNTFIADSGGSSHIVHSKHLLLTTFKEEEVNVKIGDSTAGRNHLGTGTMHWVSTKMQDGNQIEVQH